MSADRSFTVTAPAKPLVPDLQAAAEGVKLPNEEAAARVRAQRAAQHERFRAQAEMQEAEDAAEEDVPVEPIEQVENVVVRLPNGMEVDYGPRPGISNRIKIAQIVGNSINPILTLTAQILLNIRTIDGKRVRPINNLVDLQAVANQIGDDGLELLENVQVEFWKPIDRNHLPVLKKNIREP
jgi:hypothetical protein